MNKLLPARAIELAQNSVIVSGINTVFSFENDLNINSLRLLVDMIKAKLTPAVIVLGSRDNQRASLVVGLTADLCAKGLSAKNMIQEAAPLIGGSGGGRDDFAQAGGNAPDKFSLAFDKIKDIINKL
jgi:alanyl-tRNA synthetase